MVLRTRTENSLPSDLDAHSLFNFPISALIFSFPNGFHVQLSDQSSSRCVINTWDFFTVNWPECSGTGIMSNIYLYLYLYLYLSDEFAQLMYRTNRHGFGAYWVHNS